MEDVTAQQLLFKLQQITADIQTRADSTKRKVDCSRDLLRRCAEAKNNLRFLEGGPEKTLAKNDALLERSRQLRIALRG